MNFTPASILFDKVGYGLKHLGLYGYYDRRNFGQCGQCPQNMYDERLVMQWRKAFMAHAKSLGERVDLPFSLGGEDYNANGGHGDP